MNDAQINPETLELVKEVINEIADGETLTVATFEKAKKAQKRLKNENL